MINKSKMILVIVMLTGIAISALADKGIGKKSNTKVNLNITTTNSLRNSISLNLKSGLKYTGSLLVNQQVEGRSLINNTLLTYQKGNTTYIIPHRQIIAVPESSQGYNGVKLIIKTH